MDNASLRRIVLRHTAGPFPGLRQIVAVCTEAAMQYLHTGEIRKFDQGVPDKLAAFQCWPDGRVSKAMRLKSTDAYILYTESPVEAAQEAA